MWSFILSRVLTHETVSLTMVAGTFMHRLEDEDEYEQGVAGMYGDMMMVLEEETTGGSSVGDHSSGMEMRSQTEGEEGEEDSLSREWSPLNSVSMSLFRVSVHA